MRRIATILSLLMAVVGSIWASPIKWHEEVKMTSDTEGQLVITALIDRGWHLYGTSLPDDGVGPNPTSITLEHQPGVIWEGSPTPSHAPLDAVDMVFQLKLPSWTGEVSFTQAFRLQSDAPSSISGAVRYQACNDKSCIPPSTYTFTCKLPVATATPIPDSASESVDLPTEPLNPQQIAASNPAQHSPQVEFEPADTVAPEPWPYIVVWGVLAFLLTILVPGIWPKSWFNKFPEALKRTLGAGGALSTIKVSLAFIDLALGLIIYSILDMKYGWDYMDRNMFLSILIGILATLSLYLLGILKFSAATYSTRVTAVRYILALAALSFAIYLVPGLWGGRIPWIEPLMPTPYVF